MNPKLTVVQMLLHYQVETALRKPKTVMGLQMPAEMGLLATAEDCSTCLRKDSERHLMYWMYSVDRYQSYSDARAPLQ